MGRALKPPTQLNPEYERAYKKFQHELIKLPKSQTSLSSSVWITDNISSYKDRIPTCVIPATFEWVWKQTRPKVVVTYGLYDIIIKKLTPRRRKNIPKERPLPSYKLWEYQVSSQSELSYTMFWCERGRTTSAELKLDDFYFLADFMQPEVAASIWPLKTLEKKKAKCTKSVIHSFQETCFEDFFLSDKQYNDQTVPI